jgi:tetratricopeptide (TPR) repeat protein
MKFLKNNINTVFFTVMSFLSVALLILMFNVGSAPAQNLSSTYEEQPFGEYLAGRHAFMNKDYSAAAEYYMQALTLDPENIPLNQFALSVLITDGRFEDAARISRRLNDLGEETNTSNLLVFFENVKNSNYDDALEEIDELSDTGIINLVKPFFRTWILVKLGRDAEAEEMIAALDPESTFSFFNYYQSGLIFEFMGNIDKAEEYYAKSLDKNGVLNIRAVEAYGHILRVQDKNQQAIDVYDKYLFVKGVVGYAKSY